MLTFQHLLEIAGLPLSDVRLLRHQSHIAGRPSPYRLWRETPALFDIYQSTQDFGSAAKLRGTHWAAFVATPSGETLFVGLYEATLVGPLPTSRPHPQEMNCEIAADSCDLYELTRADELSIYVGRLVVDWGPGTRAWIQRADSRQKAVLELRRSFKEPAFPGFARFTSALSDIDSLSIGWLDVLRSTRGVYVLTCPRTKEQYVGSATGEQGLLGRWREYAATGHGGNVALKSREPSDYQVAVLETVGSAASSAEVEALEELWKKKLQSRELGLNRN